MKKPLPIAPAVASRSTIDPVWRPLAAALQDAAQRDLWYWAEFPVVLPETAFRADATAPGLDALLQSPTDDELDAVARDETGSLKRLSEVQRAEVRAEGRFSVDSAQYPGQRHVWALSALLQRGRGPTAERLRARVASGLEHLVVGLPRRLRGRAGEGPSVAQAARRLGDFVRVAAGLLVGLPARVPRWQPWEIDEKVAVARRRVIAEAAPGLDLSLFDPARMAQAAPVLEAISAEALSAWRHDFAAQHRAIDAALRRESLPPSEQAARLAEALGEAQRAALLARVESSVALEAVHPGLGRLVADHARAQSLLAGVDAARARAVEALRAEAEARLAAEAPLRARIPSWCAPRVEARVAPAVARAEQGALEEAARVLAAGASAQEGEIFARSRQFAAGEAEALRGRLGAERVAAQTFVYLRRVWRRRDWKAVREDDPAGGPPTYRLVCDRRVEVTTDAAGWRLVSLWQRGVTLLHNGVWALGDNLLNGPLGLRALLGAEPFSATVEVDPNTGVVGPSAQKRNTLRSRLRALWTDVRDARRAFEARPDTGLLGKSLSRWFDRLWNYLLKGAVGTLLLALGQPLLSVLNVGVSLALLFTAPLWAPLGSVAAYLVHIALYDTSHAEGARATLPLVASLVVDGLVLGAGQGLLALAMACVAHPVAAALWWVAGATRWMLRSAWDAAMFGLVLGPLGRVPASDGPLARRVEGPGLSAGYFFQVRPELVLLGLASALEREALALYQRRAEAALAEPDARLRRFVAQVVGPFVSDATPPAPLSAVVEESTGRHLAALHEALDARRALLDRTTTIPEAAHVRMTRADLAETMARAQALVVGFAPDRLLGPLSAEEQLVYWTDQGLAPGDFAGLTRVLLERAFSPGLLEPLEDSDRTLRLVIDRLDVQAYLVALEAGSPLGEALERVSAPMPTWLPSVSRVQPLDAGALLTAGCDLGALLVVPPPIEPSAA